MVQKRVPDSLDGRTRCYDVCRIYWTAVDGAETCAGLTGGPYTVLRLVPDLLVCPRAYFTHKS